MGSVSFQNKNHNKHPFFGEQKEDCNRNDRRTMRTNPVGSTPRSRAPPPGPCQSTSGHDHLGSYGLTKTTPPDYLLVTLLVVMLQRRTDPNDLENYLAEPTLEVVGLYSDHGKNYSTFFLPLSQATPYKRKIPLSQTDFSSRCKLTTYTESQKRT